MSFFGFHSVIERWFRSRFETPTEPQSRGWPSIAAGGHTLIAAPTGSGKTLTAFLACLDRLFKESLIDGLADDVRVVYVSPLRALSNDMHRNLETPLAEIAELARKENVPFGTIRAGLRTGDTSSSQRAALVRRPPHILVTTPESLYLMLTGPRSRQTLRNVDTIIIDEIHALVRDKRGSHLSLTVERLDALTTRPLQRIGLSATQKPIAQTAAFLVGSDNRFIASHKSVSYESEGSRPRLAKTLFDTPPNPQSAIGAPATAGHPQSGCTVIDVGHQRNLDLAIETPASELGAVCMHEQWAEVNERLVELVEEHRSTLIFVNTRRLAERLTHQLTELLGEEAVSSHHGSLSAEIRLKTERRLKSGQLKAVVATASLELGIDVGYIDLVVQIGSPRGIATFLQRIGRSGHSLGLTPKGRLFALTRDELLECMALIRAVKAGRLDVVRIPEAPLDVLAQQIVAEVSAEDWNTDDLYRLFRRAYPYCNLSRDDFNQTVELLSEGIAKSVGRSRVYLHHDHVGKRLRTRKGSRIAATSNAGAIPETAQFRVVAEPERTLVGSLDEDFAVESMAGDVFLLGNTSWRILHVRGGDVTVFDAQGAPPTIPFWRGEAPGRTFELSEEVARLREELEDRLAQPPGRATSRDCRGAGEKVDAHSTCPLPDGRGSSSNPTIGRVRRVPTDGIGGDTKEPQTSLRPIIRWLSGETNTTEDVARQAVEYAAAQKAAIGLLPTQKRVVFERFFDESGGMQLVVHAPFGGAINRAWGLAMRKRFCRSFDFELQATADDDGFILSLGPQHSFPIESLFPMLTRANCRSLLEQAVLAVPMFQLRWRWNVTRALLVLRRRNGKKVPPALQRFRADDLLTAVFPRLTGCQEEHTGDIPIPDHVLVQQTLEDCLFEAVDIDGLHGVLEGVERGEITFVARDTREPSPFCYELLNSNPYAFLDGGEAQERRARAVATRRSLTVESVDDLSRLDPLAIEQVRAEALPAVRDADELHDLLLSRILLPCDDVPADEEASWRNWFDELAVDRRAAEIALTDNRTAWVSAERWPAVAAVFPDAKPVPQIHVPETVRQDWPAAEARTAIVRGLIEVSGPTTAAEIARRTCLTESQAAASLEALEGEGLVLRGRFTPQADRGSASAAMNDQSNLNSELSALDSQFSVEWCHRRLLARIHRLTLQGLRREIEPVTVDVFQRFLFHHHSVQPGQQRRGPHGLFDVVAMLQGIDVPVVCWERDVLPARLADFSPSQLDELCLTGEVGWGRLNPAQRDPERGRPMASLTRVAPISLFLREDAEWLVVNANVADLETLSTPARHLLEVLRDRGASFATDLLSETRMLPAQLADVLGELVTSGIVTADGFAGLRSLIKERNDTAETTPGRGAGLRRVRKSAATGRWSVWREPVGQAFQPDANARQQSPAQAGQSDVLEQWAWQLLRRWGVVFRDLLTRETSAPRWYELLQVFRRLEARGEIRGGRFVSGVAGEQFAAGDTVRQLRKLRGEPDAGPVVTITAADPLNLVGILTDHPRVPSTAANRVAYRRGRPVARLNSGEWELFADVPTAERQLVLQALQERPLSPKPAEEREEASAAAETTADRRTATHRTSNGSRRQRPRPPRYPNNIPRPLY